MKSKRIIFASCLGAVALLASPALAQYRHSGRGRAMISAPHATAHVTRGYPRSGFTYGSTRYYGGDWRHYRHHGGSQFYFFGGYPFGYYGYYPYYWDYYYPYSYGYYYSQPASAYTGDGVVAGVQQRLADEGYYDGAVDGVLGPRTRAGIRAYESTHGMPVNGVITNRLLSRMGLR